MLHAGIKILPGTCSWYEGVTRLHPEISYSSLKISYQLDLLKNDTNHIHEFESNYASGRMRVHRISGVKIHVEIWWEWGTWPVSGWGVVRGPTESPLPLCWTLHTATITNLPPSPPLWVGSQYQDRITFLMVMLLPEFQEDTQNPFPEISLPPFYKILR